MITSDEIFRIQEELHRGYTQEVPLFLMAPRMYQRLRWYQHVAHVFPEPVRKIRKCHMRRRKVRMLRERRCYIGA